MEKNNEKRLIKRKARGNKREAKARGRLINAALDNGWTTYSKIAKNTGLSISQVQSVFSKDPDLYAKFVVCRRQIVDKAGDNIADIVDDPDHQHNFAASKYVLQNYKSDLDIHLDSKGDELEIDVAGTPTGPVVITFGGNEKDKEEDGGEKE